MIQGEALAWLAQNPADAGACVVTSLPDVSELPSCSLESWREWFVEAARCVVRWVPRSGVAIFYQSDIRFRGIWVDKGYLIMRAAEAEGACLLWHKIVCRKPPGTLGLGRPGYSHMLAIAHAPRAPRARPGPDVLPDAGAMSWSRAMGITACQEACRFLRDETEVRLVVDPFCGRGTTLAVANSMGLDALGIELAARRCRAARTLTVAPCARD